jgi:hypothetical protein
MTALPDAPISTGSPLPDGSIITAIEGLHGAWWCLHASRPGAADVQGLVPGPALQPLWSRHADAVRALQALDHPRVLVPRGEGVVQKLPVILVPSPRGERIDLWMQRQLGRGDMDGARAVELATRIAEALQSLHAFGVHGALTFLDLWIQPAGEIEITGAGWRWLALAATGGRDPHFEASGTIAPEVRDDPYALTEAADAWSLGAMVVCLLTDAWWPHAQLQEALDQVLETAPPALGSLLEALLAEEPSQRLSDFGEIRHRLVDCQAALGFATFTGVMQAVKVDDLFAGLDLPPVQLTADQRWVVRRQGRDWGPFDEDAIFAQLDREEFDEHIDILDTMTRQVRALREVPELRDRVRAWIPVRDARVEQRRQQREQMVQGVKRTSSTAVLLTTLGVLLIGWLGYLNASAVTPMNWDAVQGEWAWEVQPPRVEYEGIAADDALLAALFDFTERPAQAEEPAATRRRRPTDRARAGGDTAWDDDREPEDDYVVDLDSSLPSSLLTSDQINATVSEHLGRIRACYDQEMQINPGFRGVTASWSIRPDGRTFQVRISEPGGASSTGQACVVRAVRRMRFPQFNNVPMNVSFPLRMR